MAPGPTRLDYIKAGPKDQFQDRLNGNISSSKSTVKGFNYLVPATSLLPQVLASF
jgi:hypothetical protein